MTITDVEVPSAKKKKKKKKKQLPLAQRQLIAFQRFGLGAKPGGAAKMKDPLKALLKELNTRNIAQVVNRGNLPNYQQACRIGEMGPTALANGEVVNDVTVFRRELDARFQKHLDVNIGFVERLVLFWANHFSMSTNKEVRVVVRATIGQLERDVIRKHVLKKFPDMLVGVMSHPAMQVYLDNQISVGPNSESAKSGNEFNDVNVNLAREIMELHTVGTGGGYTETDITQLALILSGWTFVTESDASHNSDGGSYANVGQFIFKPRWHEPASARPTFKHMGVTRTNTGQAVGVAVIRWLALRPATAEHLAFKMLKHFITDRPTKAMVKPLAAAYLKSGGNLKAMAKAMLALKAAWKMPLKKFRSPYETVVAQYRAIKTRHTNYFLNGTSDGSNYQTTRWNLAFLNQQPWECLDPDGWDDDSAEWLNSDGIRVRLAAAYESVGTYAPPAVKVTPKKTISITSKTGVVALGRSIFGKNLSAATVNAMKAAPTAKAALAILFVCPELQRR